MVWVEVQMVVVEDRDAVLVEAIGALSPGLMESFKEIEAREPNELPVVPETGIPITGEEVGGIE